MGAGNEVAGTSIIAEPRPFGENVLLLCSDKGLECRPAAHKALEPRPYGRNRRLLQHHFAEPDGIGIRQRFARRRTPRQSAEVIHIMLDQAQRGIGGHQFAMAWSRAMSKRNRNEGDSPRSCRARAAGDLLGEVGGKSFRRFGFIQHSIVSRWSEIVGERYAKVSCPESIKFPSGKKAGGVLTLMVDGAHAPLIQHLTPMIVEKVNLFFGYAAINRIVFRQGNAAGPRPSTGTAATSAAAQGYR